MQPFKFDQVDGASLVSIDKLYVRHGYNYCDSSHDERHMAALGAMLRRIPKIRRVVIEYGQISTNHLLWRIEMIGRQTSKYPLEFKIGEFLAVHVARRSSDMFLEDLVACDPSVEMFFQHADPTIHPSDKRYKKIPFTADNCFTRKNFEVTRLPDEKKWVAFLLTPKLRCFYSPVKVRVRKVYKEKD